MIFALTLIIGAFIVLIGFAVNKYPNLIAGYNTMSSREKSKVDVEGLSTMMRNSLIVLGVLVALSYPLMTLFVLKQHVIGAMTAIVLFGVFLIIL